MIFYTIGCFVFKLSDNIKLEFKQILMNFIKKFCEINFCGFFALEHILSATYYPDTNTLIFNFDTESG